MKRYISIISLLALSLTAAAQTFNPTVVVTNSYEGKTIEAHKDALEMSVPDSLTRFDLNFDYSVFDNPYKGSYEFSPYLIEMRPDAKQYDGHPFYLNVGAGYALHPELDVVFSPRFKKNDRIQLGIYDNARGFFGRYTGTELNYSLENDRYDFMRARSIPGYDIRNEAGVNAIYDARNFLWGLNADFRTIAASDSLKRHIYDAVDVTARMVSKKAGKLHYEAQAGMVYAWDKIHWPNLSMENIFETEDFRLNEMDFNLKASGYYVMNNTIKVGAAIGGEYVMNGKTISNHALDIYFMPQFFWEKNRFHLRAGLKMAYVEAADQPVNTDYLNYQQKSGYLFPDVDFRFNVIKNALDAYVAVGGGNHLNSYSELIEANHFFNPSHMKLLSPILENSVENFNGAVGLRLGVNYFQADIKAGYAMNTAGRLDAFYVNSYSEPYIKNSFAYQNFDQKYVQAELKWSSDHLDFSAAGKFQDTHVYAEGPFVAVLPAKFLANGSATFNMNHRLFVGATVDFMSARDGFTNYSFNITNTPTVPMAVRIPHYVDLGVNGRFDFNSKLSAWMRVDNILNNNVQRIIGHAYDGVYFTAGICLNL